MRRYDERDFRVARHTRAAKLQKALDLAFDEGSQQSRPIWESLAGAIDTVAACSSPLECVATRRLVNLEKGALKFGTLPKIHAIDRKLERQQVGIVKSDVGQRCITVSSKHREAPSPCR